MVEDVPASQDPPWRHRYFPLRLLTWLVISVLMVYAGFCMYLFVMQTSLIYPIKDTGALLDTQEAARQARAVGWIPWDRTTPGAAAPQGYVPEDFADPVQRGTIVVFHGNGGWCVNRTKYVDAFSRRGFRVFLYEYPGYGGRPGRPSEAAIVPDARALVRSLNETGFGPVYVWGESLGSGVAAAVCADATLPVHGLALLTPWDTIANVGLHHYPYIPVKWLMIDKYDSITNLEHFRHPICVIRSGNDEIIPPSLSLNLFAHLPDPKKMILHEKYGHNDWPNSPDLSWWDEALDFIAPPRKELAER